MKLFNFNLLFIGFMILSNSAKADNVRLSKDTLYCDFSYQEVGSLKSQTSALSDLGVIKTLVLSGYINQSDEDFIHTLGKNYSLENLDMTDLHSTMSYQGLEGCNKIKTVKYSRYWTSTGQCLFQNCSNLHEVIFPENNECSITSFDNGTFRGCSSLKKITIPEKVRSLGNQVFYLCPNLKEIHCLSGNAPRSTNDSFGGQFTSAQVFVPQGSALNYQTSAGWCMFKNYVEDPSITWTPINRTSDHIYTANDSLICDLTYDEVGTIRSTILNLGVDIAKIKTVVMSGYADIEDASFLNALSCTHNVECLDFTNLRSTFSDYAFQGCTKIKIVKYSRYWNSTGWYLFKDCANLKNIEFPENYVGNGITKFETGSFRGCSSLEEIIIPQTVKSIGNQCFYACGSLKTIKIKATVPPSAGESSFGNQFNFAKLIVPKGTLQDYKTSAGWNLFSNIEEDNEDVSIDEKVVSQNVSIIDGVLYSEMPIEEIGRLKASVLSKNIDLTSIKKAILSGYINSDDANFLNALATTYSLSEIDFSSLHSSFGGFAFQGCTKLTTVNYSKYWNSTGWYLFEDCSNLTNVQFPNEFEGNGITLFETGSFRGCTSLEEIVIPTNVSSIGSQCFLLCHSLRSVKFLGSSIRNIDKGAFEGCYSLETITMPSSMTLIGERCFEGCPKIKEIHCESLTPPEVSESSFEDIYSTAVLYVPQGSRAKYCAAPVWKNFSNIVETESTGISNEIMESDSNNVGVYNLEGKCILNGVNVSSMHQVLPNGTYIIKNGCSTRKVIIKK